MADRFSFSLTGRSGTAQDEWADDTTSFAMLRRLLEPSGEMDVEDRFYRKGDGDDAEVLVADEAELLSKGCAVTIKGPRRRLEVKSSGKDDGRQVFVADRDTLGDLRRALALADAVSFVVAGKRVEHDAEATRYLRGIETVSLDAPGLNLSFSGAGRDDRVINWPDGRMDARLADLRTFLLASDAGPFGTFLDSSGNAIATTLEAASRVSKLGEPDGDGLLVVKVAPRGLTLLVLQARGASETVAWEEGDPRSTLQALRAFLGERAGSGPFVKEDDTPVKTEAESFETVKMLGDPDDLGRIRVRFGSLLESKSDLGLGDGGTHGRDSGAGGEAGRGGLRQTRDNLDILGTSSSSGAPQDSFDQLTRDVQEQVLRSFRHMHGLRLVPSGEAFELDRGLRPIFQPVKAPGEARVATRVVLPMVSTRFSASATESQTLDRVSSALSWNVGGSVGVEAKAAMVSVSSSYKESTTTTTTTTTAALLLRVEYLVARGEIIIDPREVELAPDLVETIRKLKADNRQAKADQATLVQLGELLSEYGPHVPMRTLFGGKLMYRQERTMESRDSATTVTKTFASDVKAKFKQVTVEANAGFDSSKENSSVWESNNQAIEVTMAGGDPSLALLPYRWADSLDHYPWWSVIAFADVRPTLAFLPPDLIVWTTNLLAKSSGLPAYLTGPIDWEAYVAAMTRASDDGSDSGFIS